MKMTARLENALDKLYTAFNEDTLNPECCKACAVGNICNNQDAWKNFTDTHGSLKLNYIGQVNEAFNKRMNGYLPSELLEIEAVFLKGCGYELPISRGHYKPNDPQSKEVMFNGMLAVITFLCDLDKFPNVMEISDSFARALLKKNSIRI